MSHIGRAGPPDITDTYSLLVLNISFRTTVEDLFPLFDKYGKVVDIHIPRDRRTGESRGFAFVRYKYGDEAQKAVDRLDGRQVDGREIAVQFAKYGPNAERIHKGRILEPIAKVRSPRPRERDYHRGSRSRSVDRYERDRYRERERSSRRRSRSRSYSPGYRRGRGRDRYDDERSYGSRSPRSASPPRRSRSSRRSPSPRKRVSSRSPPLSRSASPDRRSPKERSVSPRRSLSPRKGSPDGRLDNSRSPSPHQSDEK